MKKLLFTLLLPCTLLATRAAATIYTVSSLADAGPGSLRAAITSANAAAGNTIAFGITGTINVAGALPNIIKPMTVDGTTAAGYAGIPLVGIDFNGWPGLCVSTGANGTIIKGLSLTGAGNAGLSMTASNVTVAGNYIGLTTGGLVDGNFGDGIKIMTPSGGNLIGSTDILTGITYYDTSDTINFTLQPVSLWQGIRNYAPSTMAYLICGTVNTSGGLLYVGPVAGGGGTSYNVTYPGTDTVATSVYGPSNLSNGEVCLVGIYRTNDSPSTIYNYGFVWQGALTDLPSGGTYQQILYPNAKYNYIHSTMGNLAVGNCDGPKTIDGKTVPVGAGQAFIYNIDTKAFIANIVYPGSKSNSVYGIWQNSNTTYTLVGGYSPIVANTFPSDNRPLAQGKGYMVDYDSSTNKFTNWTSFSYPNGAVGVNFITHFQGISSAQPGVYTLAADSVQANTQNPVQGSWVNVTRNTDGTFTSGTWEDLSFTQNGVPATGVTSANSVYGDNVVGIIIGPTAIPYQAIINTGFQLSNVISGNRGNGINLYRTKNNTVSMNYIGTDPTGETAGFGNGSNGVYITATSSKNLIGGQFVDYNNPTGNKHPANAVFQTPPQGNLISGNLGDGVLIDGASIYNTLSGNFIGTDKTGNTALANGGDGVVFDGSNGNSLAGCTFYQNPFVYYNVVSGNLGHGVRITNSNSATVQANFLGMGANNATSVANSGDGLLVNGTGNNTQVGGVIPLGNVISGNTRNGIEVADKVSGFTSFNTFGGLAAFQLFASPNGGDGTLVTATGGNNLIRTCILSGNNGNGLEIAGNASGVQVSDVSLGTTTDINAALPNQGNGIVIGGTAHGNSIGGFQPSVEPTVFSSGNKKYGILVTGTAYSNTIVHANVGIVIGGSAPNTLGGIFLDRGTRATTISGNSEPLKVNIQTNTGTGLYLYYSTQNKITNAFITGNASGGGAGLYGFGACTSTTVTGSTIINNGPGGNNNIDISRSTGITVKP